MRTVAFDVELFLGLRAAVRLNDRAQRKNLVDNHFEGTPPPSASGVGASEGPSLDGFDFGCTAVAGGCDSGFHYRDIAQRVLGIDAE